MEGCDRLDSEMADLEGFQCESPSAIDQDDEDEVEELRNSLREAVQDPSVKPKLQCLMVDPSFSMVTVQSEDSGIVWETASSRCSTPWASETSSISEGYSMDGSGTQGQITIVFDDEQIVRRRIRSGGRSSRLSDRLRRPGSSRSGSALGVERLEMAEVSVPNVKQEKTQGEPDLEEIKDKDQQLFSLISEGYEILNIRVPSKLPTVDEEESTDLQDNLSYLDKTPGIKSKKVSSQLMSQDLSEDVEVEIVENKEASEQDSTDSIGDSKIKRHSTGDMDYFEKFTLVDVVVPGKQAPESQQEANIPAAKPQKDEEMPGQETSTDSPTASDESFVFVTDTEMAGDHLDQMFYGNGAHETSDDTPQGREEAEMNSGEKIRVRRASQRSQKDNGSVLFCSEQTVLTPIFLSPGPPKIIDQILLDEPTAMSYMYSDLYEDAVGERTTSEGECSEAEHVASEKIFIRRLSDSEEADGYLEMFTLRDETSMVEVQPEKDSVEDKRAGRRMWSQNVFEMTGSLTRVKDEVEEKEPVMNEEARREEECAVKKDLESTKDKGEEGNVVTQMKVVETEPSAVRDEKVSPIRTCPEELTEMPEEKETINDTEVKQEVTKVQSEPFGSGVNKTESLPETQEVEMKVAEMGGSKEQQKAELLYVPGPEPQVESQLQEASDKVEAVVEAKEETATMIVPDVVIKPEAESDIVDTTQVPARNEEVLDKAERVVEIKESVTEEAAVQKEDKVKKITEAKVNVTGGVEVDEALTQEPVEAEKPNDEPLSGEIDSALIEMDEPAPIIIDSKAAVQAAVGVVEEALNSKANSIYSPEVMAVNHKPDIKTQVEQPEVEAEAKPRLDLDLTDISATDQSQPESKEESVTIKELDKKELPSDVDTTKISSVTTHDTMNVDDDFVLLVPKGKAVEMDIEIGWLSERVDKSDPEGPPEAGSTCDDLPAPQVCPASPPSQPEPKFTIHPETEIQPDPSDDAEEEKEADVDLEEEGGALSRLRSFTPLEDLSGLQREEVSSAAEVSSVTEVSPAAEVRPATAMHTDDVEPETDRASAVPETSKEGTDQQVQHSTVDGLPQAELHREVVEETDQTAEGLPEAGSTCDDLHTPPVCPASPPSQPEPIFTHPEPEIQPDPVSEEQVLPVIILCGQSPSLPVDVEEAVAEEEKEADVDLEEEGGALSCLRSFTPLEDLSGLQREEVSSAAEVSSVTEVSPAAEVSPATEMHADDVEPETDRASAVPETSTDGTDQQVQHSTVDDLPQAALHREVVEETDQTAEELEYEIITKQEAREMPAPEEKPDVEEPLLQSEEGKIETEKQDMEIRMEEREPGLPPGEEPIEAEYDIIDAEEESQARAAAELQGMNWFCFACGCLLSEEACASGEHQDHERTSVDRAYEDIKEKLSDWISELQARSENIEDLVSELELAYNSVEDQCAEIEESMQSQNEEMMALVMEQYNGMSLSMEEEKKAKLEQLYDQIVSSQENIDSAKGILETTSREAETEARSPEDIEKRLKAALKSAMSLELGPKGLLVFENYTKGNNSSAHLKQRKGIPVPLKPTLQPQEPGSATSTSVTVYWNVNPGDIIDCFQVYCIEDDPQGAVSEEYRVTVKESYCVLEELKPNKTYRVWVMAVNYSGCSLPSERLAFSTAPSVPVIDPGNCSVLWGLATLRWASDHLSPGCSYTLEYCRQYELEGEGLRSISGIEGAEQKVLLQPNENYLFYIKAVNEAGSSEQSEAALISTKGTRFRLVKASAHPLLELSEDLTTVRYDLSTHDNTQPSDPQFPTILGELLPARGRYYWETVVTGCAAYRVGVAYETANRSSPLGQNSKSWCLQCTPTASSCGYRLLHNGVTSDVVVIEMPERVGTLMDYQQGRLSFYNAQSGQLLGSLSHRFAQPCHPTLGLEQPGSLAISMALEVPAFANHS